MNGTDKQILWAEQIKAGAQPIIAAALNEAIEWLNDSLAGDDRLPSCIEAVKARADEMMNEQSASKWIDMRAKFAPTAIAATSIRINDLIPSIRSCK